MKAAVPTLFARTHLGAALIFGGLLVAPIFVSAYSYYTCGGRGVNEHPFADLGHDVGHQIPYVFNQNRTEDIEVGDGGVAGCHAHRRSSHPRS